MAHFVTFKSLSLLFWDHKEWKKFMCYLEEFVMKNKSNQPIKSQDLRVKVNANKTFFCSSAFTVSRQSRCLLPLQQVRLTNQTEHKSAS